jgi:Tfp pilus assembly protein PilN
VSAVSSPQAERSPGASVASVARQVPSRRPQPVVNLARRPFANTRYIRRLGIALWIVGVLLFAVDGVLYWHSLFGIESKKEQRVALDRAIAEERERLAAADRQIATIDLGRQNVEATYLNARIAQRTFPWSSLFDELARVLPRRVRLHSLTPMAAGRRGRGQPQQAQSSEPSRQRVLIQLTGVAESDEALLELIDNLFDSPAFEDPALPKEVRQPQGIQFAMNAYFLPGRSVAAPAALAAAELVEDPAGDVAAAEEAP